MRCRLRALVGLGVLALLHPAVAGAQQTTFTPLGSLAGAQPGSEVHDLSGDGTVAVGGCPDTATCTEAWRWTAIGGIQGLGFLPGETSSEAEATSADGSVVFGESGSLFRWTSGGGMVDIGSGLPSFDFLSVGGASADGLLAVGSFASLATFMGDNYRWTQALGIELLDPFTIPSTVEYADVSADGTTIAGSEGAIDSTWPFVLTEAGKTFPPPLDPVPPVCEPTCHFGSASWAISDDGLTLVGQSFGRPFRWTEAGGTVEVWLPPGSEEGIARDVSSDGSVIVGSLDDTLNPHAFLWTAQTGARDLRQILVNRGIDLTGWTLLQAVAVSSDGTVIAGNGVNPSGDPEAFLAVVPAVPAVPALPAGAAWTLPVLLALAALGIRDRRRRPRFGQPAR